MQIDDFTLGKRIGQGSFGEVYLTTRNGYNKLYATKKVSKQKIELPSVKKHFIDEIEILKTLNHKNIIKLETIRQSQNNFYIICEYYNGGGLYDCLKQYKKRYGRPFPENIVQHFMRQIIDALIYLHQRKIIHRDLKLENLLINYESEEDKNNFNLLKAEVKIIDFGFATKLNGANLRYSILGSPINMDPILLTKLNNQNISYLIGYDEKADIWSLGTVCYEMVTGEMLFQVINISQLVQRVEIGIYHIPTNLSQEIASFLQGMLQYLGKDRLSAVELSSHPFLTKNVNEFQKIDLSNPNNKFDNFGLIVNIKKSNQNGINVYDIVQRYNLNPYSQQSYNYQQGFNYFGNKGPKYYRANVNKTNYNNNQYNQQQYNQPQLINQYQMQSNPYRRINTYKQQSNKYQNIPKPHQSQKQLNNFYKNDNRNINDLNEAINGGRTINEMEQKRMEENNNLLNININANINNNNTQKDFPLNKTNIPQPDSFDKSPFPYSSQSDSNRKKLHSSFAQFDTKSFYDEFKPQSKMNNSFIKKEKPLYDKKYFNMNETRKEISSDALDNLFDFNIGKELEPEPDIKIDDTD